MTVLDSPFRNLAHDLIAKYGKTVTFSKPGTATYDPVTGTNTPGTPTTTTVKVSPPEAFKINEVNGTTIQAQDVKVSAAAVDYVPDISQTVTFDGNAYNIISVSPIYSGDLVVKYDCQLRK